MQLHMYQSLEVTVYHEEEKRDVRKEPLPEIIRADTTRTKSPFSSELEVSYT